MFLVAFWAFKKGVLLLAMQASLSHRILSKNILICVPKMNKGLTGVVRHEAGAVILTPFALSMAGFSAAGITAGSLGAGMMSSAAIANGGGVAAGSLVALLQSAGAAGMSAAATAGVASVGGTAGGLLGGAVGLLKRMRR